MPVMIAVDVAVKGRSNVLEPDPVSTVYSVDPSAPSTTMVGDCWFLRGTSSTTLKMY